MPVVNFTRWFTKPAPDSVFWSGESDDVVVLHGATGRVLRISDAIEGMTGYVPADFIGERLGAFAAPHDKRRIAIAMSQSCVLGEPARAKIDLRHKNGADIAVEIVSAADQSGYIRSIIRRREATIAWDLSNPVGPPAGYDEKLSGEQVDDSFRQTSQSDLTSQQFIDITHDLRTPLNAVIGFADMMRHETFGAIGHEKYKEYANFIHKSGEHVLQLVNDLLDLSRLEARKYELLRAPTSLSQIAQDVVDICSLSATEAGLTLSFDGDDGLALIDVDEKAIKQIVFNLVSNAIKFTEKGSVHVRTFRDGGTQRLVVNDTGVGLSEDQLQRIGERFIPGQRDGIRGNKGSGLGLAVSKGLAELHGGALRFQSAEGEGTVVALILPAPLHEVDYAHEVASDHCKDVPVQGRTRDMVNLKAALTASLAESAGFDHASVSLAAIDEPSCEEISLPLSGQGVEGNSKTVHELQSIVAENAMQFCDHDVAFESLLSKLGEKLPPSKDDSGHFDSDDNITQISG